MMSHRGTVATKEYHQVADDDDEQEREELLHLVDDSDDDDVDVEGPPVLSKRRYGEKTTTTRQASFMSRGRCILIVSATLLGLLFLLTRNDYSGTTYSGSSSGGYNGAASSITPRRRHPPTTGTRNKHHRQKNPGGAGQITGAKQTGETTHIKVNTLHGGRAEFELDNVAALQVKNYRQGHGMIVNVQPEHQGGRRFCQLIGQGPNRKAPVMECMLSFMDLDAMDCPRMRRSPIPGDPRNQHKDGCPYSAPWRVNETAASIDALRPHYHAATWQFDIPPLTPLQETNWEDPGLVSLVIMRHPISRAIIARNSGTKWEERANKEKYPGIDKRLFQKKTPSGLLWPNYVNNHTKETDNFALRILGDEYASRLTPIAPGVLDRAKELVSRFTFVIDIECIDESLEALAALLNIQENPEYADKYRPASETNGAKSYRDRIGDDDVYDLLVERNKLDIELYEWSKSISLVDCSKLTAKGHRQ